MSESMIIVNTLEELFYARKLLENPDCELIK